MAQLQQQKAQLVDLGLLLLMVGEWQMVETLTRLVQSRGLAHE